MIDPRTQYILYHEQETALTAQIERNLEARERNRSALPRTGPAQGRVYNGFFTRISRIIRQALPRNFYPG